MNHRNNNRCFLFVAGPPCSGKSSAGKLAASIIDLPFLDLDALVEERAGMSIQEIFGGGGECEFRDLESTCLRELILSGNPSVVALGGGCLIDAGNLLLARENGVIVTLTAEQDVLLKRRRHQHSHRPLAGRDEDLISLLRSREQHYRSLPNRIDTTYLSIHRTAEIIRTTYELI